MPARPARQSTLRVALLGLGTVGRDVARGLLERSDELAAAAGGRELRLVAVGVREPDRDRGLALPAHVRLTDDLASLVGAPGTLPEPGTPAESGTGAEPGVDVVVELLGGLEPAGELIVAALDAGKAVVTANKALLARRGVALEAHARRTGGRLRFEAAVGGGIPILGPLAGDLAANRWHEVRGIVNGSTNFVLTAMARDGRAYAEIVSEAKSEGYLEADPSADVEGRDAADKLAILIRLAFGAWPDVTAIRRNPPALTGDGPPGITGITAELLAIAAGNGLTVKLVARARRHETGAIEAFVMPCALPTDSPLARTAGVENRIELEGRPVGRVAFSGPGAGGAATSSAVLGDLLALARGEGSTWASLPPAAALRQGLLDEGLEKPQRWLTAEVPGESALTGQTTLSALRRQLTGGGLQGTLYPVLDDVA